MKRDMELIRELLFAVESHDSPETYIQVSIEGRSEEEINYHLLLLKDAGFIEAVVMESLGGVMVQPLRLTWSGHEFIDAARSNKVWEGAKAFALRTTGTVTLEGLKLAIPYVMKALMGG